MPIASKRVLVVDDDKFSRTFHRNILAREFDVLTATSGAEALELCATQLPDLIVLDVMMDGIDGYETCQKVRKFSSCPIIFATAHASIEEHLKAFDAGGNAVVTKPVSPEILLRKAEIAIEQHIAHEKLKREKGELHNLAMNFLNNVGSTGTLLNFIRGSVSINNVTMLAEQLLEACASFGQQCIVQIREENQALTTTWHGEATQLEVSILAHTAKMGRVFQFKNQLAINFEHVSILSTNLPNEQEYPEAAGSARDNLTILAETADALLENIEVRQAAIIQAEQLQVAIGHIETALSALQGRQRQMLMDTRLLLQALSDKFEACFSWLGVSQDHEHALRDITSSSIQTILALLNKEGDIDAQFTPVLDALFAGKRKKGAELF